MRKTVSRRSASRKPYSLSTAIYLSSFERTPPCCSSYAIWCAWLVSVRMPRRDPLVYRWKTRCSVMRYVVDCSGCVGWERIPWLRFIGGVTCHMCGKMYSWNHKIGAQSARSSAVLRVKVLSLIYRTIKYSPGHHTVSLSWWQKRPFMLVVSSTVWIRSRPYHRGLIIYVMSVLHSFLSSTDFAESDSAEIYALSDDSFCAL